MYVLPTPGRCAVMGIVNVTEDSFSDGGRFVNVDAACAHGLALWRRGADLVDVGGESTRPGAERISTELEIARVIPVIRTLSAEGVLISVDTTRAVVAEAAVEAGAIMVNDVSGGLADPVMVDCVAQLGVLFVVTHWRGPSNVMNSLATYQDVVAEVRAELGDQADRAIGAGVSPEAIVLDPGLGFAKNATHNWQLLNQLNVLISMGFPVLVGASRKRFLGTLLADGAESRPVGQREDATTAVTALAAAAGAWGVRVHEVGPSLDAVTVAAAWVAGGTR